MYRLDNNHSAIVADIGGTFARFSLVNLQDLSLDKIEVFPCAQYLSLEAALTTYQLRHSLNSIQRVAIAIACPVIDDLVCMTNHHWQFSIAQLKKQFQLAELQVINDFSALANSLWVLKPNQLKQIGEATSDLNKPKVVLGAGTGLGVGYTLPSGETWATEGGHSDWGATSDQEWAIYQLLQKKYGHVSHERILSGQGIEHLYEALAKYHRIERVSLKAEEIIPLALAEEDIIAKVAVEQFFLSLASFAGDLALTFGAFGGVYLAGGVVTRLLPLLKDEMFRAQFEAKGRFQSYNAQIPTYVITAEQPGILGAAAKLKYSLQGALNVQL